jgi:hypothetical protein
LRHEFQAKSKEIEDKYEKELKQLQSQLEIRHKTEMHEIEELKNQQIRNLMKNNENSLSDMKNYYSDIISNHLALIEALKVLISNNLIR